MGKAGQGGKATAASYAVALSDVPEAQRERAVRVAVESPYGLGVDRVSMVDPITAMARQGRISEREVRAAERYRAAFDAVHSSGCSAFVLDVIDGRGGANVSDRRMLSARDLADAGKLLGPMFEMMLQRVVSSEATIEQLGRSLGERDKRSAKAAGSAIVRLALRTLADAWEPQPTTVAK